MKPKEAKSLLRELDFDDREWSSRRSHFEHCIEVSGLALALGKIIKQRGFNIDIQMCETGGLLHDLTVAISAPVQQHVYRGSVLRASPYETVEKVTEEYSANEAGYFHSSSETAIPLTLEEKVISFADHLAHSKRRGENEERKFGNLGIKETFVDKTERELAEMTGISNLREVFESYRIVT